MPGLGCESKFMRMKTTGRKPNILAVDDYEANITALEAVLGADYNVIAASSGTEAITLLSCQSDFDVILMDIQMPGMDGFATVEQIKQIPGCEHIPVIFITAVYKEDPFVKKGYDVGGVDYFSKPFNPDILKMKVGIYSGFKQKSEMLRQREIQVREAEELLRVGRKLSAALESLPVGVLIVDVEGRICQMNEQVSRICHTGAFVDPDQYGEMLGWWDSTGRIIKEKNTPLHVALEEGKTSHNLPLNISCANGVTKKIVSSASPLLSLDGRIVGAVAMLQDVTESRKIEEDLEEKITNLVTSGYALEETLAN